MALVFSQAEQQATLPPEQRLVMMKDVCKAAVMQVGQYEVGPYLEEIKDEIEILYPQDILTIIAKRRKTTTAGSSTSNTQHEATPDPVLPSTYSQSTRLIQNCSDLYSIIQYSRKQLCHW